MREAMYYEAHEDGVICKLCPHECHIKEGNLGICQTRKNEGGRLYALNYGGVAAIQVDPIEKKPIYNWHQGTQILSIGSFGCNLHCPFCQNHDLVAAVHGNMDMTPKEVVEKAIDLGLNAIAYTYNEPTVYYEMVYETAKLAKSQGLFNVMVTNGYINMEPLEDLLPYMDAFNVDIKSYSDELFRKICGGRLKPVIEMIKRSQSYAHVEVTLLMVPELYGEILQRADFFKWLRYEIGDVTVHMSRYFPRYHHRTPATDVQWMLEVQKEALAYFSEVYLGNV